MTDRIASVPRGDGRIELAYDTQPGQRLCQVCGDASPLLVVKLVSSRKAPRNEPKCTYFRTCSPCSTVLSDLLAPMPTPEDMSP